MEVTVAKQQGSDREAVAERSWRQTPDCRNTNWQRGRARATSVRGYIRLAEDRKILFRKEGWVRRHIRKCFWQRWHSPSGRMRALLKLDVPFERAGFGRMNCKAWSAAKHPVMQEALSNRQLRRHGFLVPSDLDAITRDGTNRRMRKTARPVV